METNALLKWTVFRLSYLVIQVLKAYYSVYLILVIFNYCQNVIISLVKLVDVNDCLLFKGYCCL